MKLLTQLALVTMVAVTPALVAAQPASNPAPGSSASAPGKVKQGKGRFKAADKDGDGAISKAEADAAGMKGVSKNFDKMDANKDGKVSRDEAKAWRQANKGKHGGKRKDGAAPAAPATK
jgi:hypothetical protein